MHRLFVQEALKRQRNFDPRARARSSENSRLRFHAEALMQQLCCKITSQIALPVAPSDKT
jgi:hypothetical protein